MVSGWGQHLDDLAAAVSVLLTDQPVRTAPMIDAAGALVCRDAVVGQLRALVGSLTGTPVVIQARALNVADVTGRPGRSLHQALSGLPRVSPFGAADSWTFLAKGLPAYEQVWREAARATLGLEVFVGVLGQIPDRHAWSVLRDLADLSAAVPLLDHGLAQALLPGRDTDADLTVAYGVLTDPAHDAVRVCTTEIRARVAAQGPSTRPAPRPPAVLGDGQLDQVMAGYVRVVLDRGANLSLGDMRAVSRVLECGGADAATVLERVGSAVAGADAAAAALRQVGPLALQLRLSPSKTLGAERLEVLRGSADLQARMRALAVQERSTPGGASPPELRRLAIPALEFTQHVPALARALEVAVGESLAAGLALVPSATDRRNKTTLSWVTAGMRSAMWEQDGTAPVLQAAQQLIAAAARVTPAVQAAADDLHRHQQQSATEAVRVSPVALARAHAGAARAQLREVLTQQAGRHAALTVGLPTHPSWPPEGPTLGRRR
jgi:hypothetical protein